MGTTAAAATSVPPDVLSQYSVLGSPSVLGRGVYSVTNTGFAVSDLKVAGPVIVLNNAVLLWDVPQYGVGGPNGGVDDDDVARLPPGSIKDPASPCYGWTADMFKIFEAVEPTPDILVIGTGGTMALLPPAIRKYLTSLGMQVEVQGSKQAASTYNVLLQEGRKPACALLPVIPTSARTGLPLVDLVDLADRKTEE
ncbi:NADH dehydrogenase 1 alpha subcomplex assembly factor 3 [Entophlyctis helioformis]|nr:NADH dehydrogenase 1 alpha subcomplex assembly factor 3 [Entophlyctis helioformis]